MMMMITFSVHAIGWGLIFLKFNKKKDAEK